MIMTFQVIAMDNVDVALLQLGGTGEAVCQARKVIVIVFIVIIISKHDLSSPQSILIIFFLVIIILKHYPQKYFQT